MRWKWLFHWFLTNDFNAMHNLLTITNFSNTLNLFAVLFCFVFFVVWVESIDSACMLLTLSQISTSPWSSQQAQLTYLLSIASIFTHHKLIFLVNYYFRVFSWHWDLLALFAVVTAVVVVVLLFVLLLSLFSRSQSQPTKQQNTRTNV